MKPRSKVWIEKGGEVVAGDGKVKLLAMIDKLGSIQGAANKMGMSYRHAWGFIQKMEKHWGAKLVQTQIGGRKGGGAKLTLQGKDFLQRFFKFRDGLDEYIADKFLTAFKNQGRVRDKRKADC
jgi:molybdate transport system regulatory protein